MGPAIARRHGQESEVSHHHGAPHLHGHDRVLPHHAAAACAPAAEHAQIRSHRAEKGALPRSQAWKEIRAVDSKSQSAGTIQGTTACVESGYWQERTTHQAHTT